MLGANGIVGAGIPLATGAALTAQVKRTGGVAVAFFGDGASNQGQFHESLNLAAVWKLPVVYVVENNGYGEFDADRVRRPGDATSPCAPPRTACRASIADGMDFFDVYDKAGQALARARRGEGPDAARVQDLSLLRPLRRRPAHLPDARKRPSSGSADARSARARCATPSVLVEGLRRCAAGRAAARSTARWSGALSGGR